MNLIKHKSADSKKTYKKKAHLPPGSLIYSGLESEGSAAITFLEYSAETFCTSKPSGITELENLLQTERTPGTKIWININGISDLDLISWLGEKFDIHPLLLEDVLNSNHRAKIENYEDMVFAIVKNFSYHHERLFVDHVAVILKKNIVISFQDKQENIYPAVYDRIKTGGKRFRGSGPDYLFYVLIDYLVDNYILLLEDYDESLDNIQEKLFYDPDQDDLITVHKIKKELQLLRQAVRPTKDRISLLVSTNSPLIEDQTKFYFKDTLDHLNALNENLDNYRDSITGLMDTYLSNLSHKMNQVMKVLTIISTIFIPLTFIAGVYGMNFSNMPELHWNYGYPVAMSIMFIIGISLLIFFKRKKWF